MSFGIPSEWFLILLSSENLVFYSKFCDNFFETKE